MRSSIFIVGAGPGIGAATATRFARAGWTVILGGRHRARLDPMVDALQSEGHVAEAVQVDAVDAAQLRAVMGEADRRAGGLSAVLFNAATVRQQDLFSMTDAEVADDLAVNILGGIHTIRAAHTLFEQRGGVILLTGGGLALAPHAAFASLGLGKAALRNLVEGLAPDLAQRNIRIAIATVGTPIAPGSKEADEVANLFWRLATENEVRWEENYPPSEAG